MNRQRRYLLAGSLACLVYVGSVGFLATTETQSVFVGAGHTPWGIWVPKSRDVAWDSLRIRASDGVFVFLVESRLPNWSLRPWAIYFHGNAGVLGTRSNVGRYRVLRDAGFNVLAIEFRGYGASAQVGSPSEAGVYRDAEAGWDYLTQTLGVSPQRILVYGWSLGSGPAVYLAARKQPGALVTEGAFTSLPAVAASRHPWAPAHLIMRNRFDNLSRASALSVPWILFHSGDDSKVPFEHGTRLAAVGKDARLIPLSSGHGNGVIADTGAAAPALRELARRLGMEEGPPRP